MTDIERQRAKLALGAALNATIVYCDHHLARPENVRDLLIGELEDWFAMEPVTSGQFDRTTTLEYVRSEPLRDLVECLDEMGKNPFSSRMAHFVQGANGEAVPMWEEFMQNQMKAIEGLAAAADV